MKITIVSLLVISSSISFASTPDCRRRLFTEPGNGAAQQKMIDEQGSRAFIKALIAGEFPDTYFLPLHTLQVTDKDYGTETTIAGIIGNLDENVEGEKKIMDAYFSQISGKSYLEGLLRQMDLEQMAEFFERCPFIADYIDPFTLILSDEHSLGFYVEIDLCFNRAHAQTIKNVYEARNRQWIIFRSMYDDTPEFELIRIYREGAELMNKIVDIYNKSRTHGVIQAFLNGEIPAKAYELDFEKVMVDSTDDKEVSLGSRIRKRIKQDTRDKQDALQVYRTYIASGGLGYAITLMEEAKASKDLSRLAEEIEWCPALAQYLFDPLVDLAEFVEQFDTSGDLHARRIKAVVTPQQCADYRAFYDDARHLQKCIRENKLDERGAQILKAPNRGAQPCVQWVAEQLPSVLDGALLNGDLEMIEDAHSWLLALHDAGIALKSTISSDEYQDKLKARKDKLAQDAAQKKSTAVSDKKKGEAPWLSPTKLFLIGAAGIISYFVYDQLKSSSAENKHKKQGSPEDSYEGYDQTFS